MNEISAAYQRAKVKSITGELNFMMLQTFIEEIESEDFENHAGYLKNFVPWQKAKEILGMIIDDNAMRLQ